MFALKKLRAEKLVKITDDQYQVLRKQAYDRYQGRCGICLLPLRFEDCNFHHRKKRSQCTPEEESDVRNLLPGHRFCLQLIHDMEGDHEVDLFKKGLLIRRSDEIGDFQNFYRINDKNVL